MGLVLRCGRARWVFSLLVAWTVHSQAAWLPRRARLRVGATVFPTRPLLFSAAAEGQAQAQSPPRSVDAEVKHTASHVWWQGGWVAKLACGCDEDAQGGCDARRQTLRRRSP